MKRLIGLLFLIVVSISIQGQSKYNKYFSDFDIKPENLAKMDITRPSSFWSVLQDTNKNLNKLLNIGSKTMANAITGKEQLKQYQEGAISYRTISQSERLNRLGVFGGFTDFSSVRFICVQNNEKNAGMTPGGLMAVNSSLLDCMTNNELLGIMAHEMTHYILQHSLAVAYAYEKRKTTNRNIASALTLLTAAAAGYGDSMTGSNTAQVYSDPNYLRNFFDGVDDISHNYYCRYNREQEIECDITAYRFLEFMEIDPRNYISALKKLGTEHDYLYSKKWDHPTVTERINILEALDNKYKSQIDAAERKLLLDCYNSLKKTTINKEEAHEILENIKVKYIDNKCYKEALSEFQKIGKYIYENERALSYYAYTYSRLGNYDMALALYKEFDKKYSTNCNDSLLVNVYKQISLCISQVKTYRSTDNIPYLTRLLKMALNEYDKTYINYLIGGTYFNANEAEKAIQYLQTARDLAGEEEQYKGIVKRSYYFSSLMYYKLLKDEESRICMKKAAKLGDQNAIEYCKKNKLDF